MPKNPVHLKDFAGLISRLRKRVSVLDKELLVGVDGPSASPTDYETRVQAYCVLSHAALEECVESICTMTVDKAMDEWTNKRRVSECLLAFLASGSERLGVPDDRDASVTQAVVRHRDLLNKRKSTYLETVRGNHGVAIKYLRRMLYPIAVDFDDTKLLASLAQVVQTRGDYAHTIGARHVPSPNDARLWVHDCIRLCHNIAWNAVSRLE